MTDAIRRVLATVSASLVAVLAMAAPATAQFADRATLPSMTVSTETVAAPTNVTATLDSCNGRWMSLTVSWSGSSSRGVSGYVVDAHLGDGSTVTVGRTVASSTSFTTTIDKLSAPSTTSTFTVITQTTYGWTAESPASSPVTC